MKLNLVQNHNPQLLGQAEQLENTIGFFRIADGGGSIFFKRSADRSVSAKGLLRAGLGKVASKKPKKVAGIGPGRLVTILPARWKNRVASKALPCIWENTPEMLKMQNLKDIRREAK
jgi:hypothetical protein